MTWMMKTMKTELKNKFMSLLMEMTESPSFVNAQLMCYTCDILHKSMTYCTLSDNDFGLDHVLMVMLDQVLIQPDL